LTKEALYYEMEGVACRCLLCPRRCLISDGEAGFCRVRAADGGKLYAASYGAAAGLAIDPIEKKPLYQFRPGSVILSYGSYGCNMRCPWCQNNSISQNPPPTSAPRLEPTALLRQAVSTADSQNNIGIAFTYNEPLTSPEFIMDTAPLLRAAGLATVIVTNATVCEAPFKDILPHADAMNIDLKGFTDGFYNNCGASLETVKRNIAAAAQHPGCHIEVTTLIVPGENDSEETMEAEAAWLAGIDECIPLHITRFFPRWKATDKEPTPREPIEALAKTARRHLKSVYTGNI
jgi:pyruvate formate lyase activating enzyme